MSTFLIGTSGWSYRDWIGPFYPNRLPSSKWFAYYVERFPTVELNVTFYRIPTFKAVDNWAAVAPPGFTFALKIYREITHIRRLHGVEYLLANYFEAVQRLGDKLKVILIQLPPGFHYSQGRAAEFFDLLRAHGPGYRYAIECRHASWFNHEFYELLRRYSVTLCIADWGQGFPSHDVITAPFLYVRFHGPGLQYASKYSYEQMAHAAARIRGWLAQGLDVYIYFNNDTNGYAIENGHTLRDLLETGEDTAVGF